MCGVTTNISLVIYVTPSCSGRMTGRYEKREKPDTLYWIGRLACPGRPRMGAWLSLRDHTSGVITVIVPSAHDESRVIGRLLRRLATDPRPEELDVIVVPNGCTDDTAGK